MVIEVVAAIEVDVIVHGVGAVKTLANPNLQTGKPLALNPVAIHQIVHAVAVIVAEEVAEAMGEAVHNLNGGRVNESISFCHSI